MHIFGNPDKGFQYIGESSGIMGIGRRMITHMRAKRRSDTPSLHYMVYNDCLESDDHYDIWISLTNTLARNLQKPDVVILEATTMTYHGALPTGGADWILRDPVVTAGVGLNRQMSMDHDVSTHGWSSVIAHIRGTGLLVNVVRASNGSLSVNVLGLEIWCRKSWRIKSSTVVVKLLGGSSFIGDHEVCLDRNQALRRKLEQLHLIPSVADRILNSYPCQVQPPKTRGGECCLRRECLTRV